MELRNSCFIWQKEFESMFVSFSLGLIGALTISHTLKEEAVDAPLPWVQPNIALIVIDDIGVDLIAAYAEAPVQAACTPNIDRLAAQGLMFREAWASTMCSSTRAQIMTGRHGFRTGIGDFIHYNDTVGGLDVGEVTLPRALTSKGYATSAAGKWHLALSNDTGNGQGRMHPLHVGFQWYAGSMHNLGAPPTSPIACPTPRDYSRWVKNTNGSEDCISRYPTIDTAIDAASRAAAMPEPWFLYVAFNAAHAPAHVAPAALCPNHSACTCSGSVVSHVSKVKSMVEALDTELGYLIANIRAVDPDSIVILIGDNGTTKAASEGASNGCFDPNRAKGTPYEAGVRVPLILHGTGIPVGECNEMVGAIDLFATILELAGVTSTAEDSVSMVPYLLGVTAPQRRTLYAERFMPNGPITGSTFHSRTLRDERFKLIVHPSGDEEFFDLANDACESVNLCQGSGSCAGLSGAAAASYVLLRNEMMAMGVY